MSIGFALRERPVAALAGVAAVVVRASLISTLLQIANLDKCMLFLLPQVCRVVCGKYALVC